MADTENPDDRRGDFAEIKEQFDNAQRFQLEYDEKRKKLVELQYKLQAMELQVGAATEELRSLEGFSMTGLLSSLRGNRQERTEEARNQLFHLQTQFDAAADAFTSLEHQVADLEKRLSSGAQARTQYEAAFSAKLRQAETGNGESAARLCAIASELSEMKKQVEHLNKAFEAGDDARKGLLEEIETLSTMGRCRVAEANKAISMVINTALQSTYDQCAGRVRQACRRFAHRFGEAIGHQGPEVDDLHKALTRIGDQFDKNWFFSKEEINSNGYVIGMLQNACMVIERKQKDVCNRMSQLTEERRRLVEA